ncbi:hypothetical protein FOZ63_030830 [Perkinsus olseni]|uniref:Uncharacterized protein n=2 Tax=Perkinsus olseni TaxID=32597 RepID=A0A7J6QNU2_PEROL|nr:hypothetical protein FOZ63_030830 [Perkinsus olseni]
MVGLTGTKLTMMDQAVIIDLKHGIAVSKPLPRSTRFPVRLSSPAVRIVDFSHVACCLACRLTLDGDGLLINLRKFANQDLTEKFYEDPSALPTLAPDLDVNMEALLLPVMEGDDDSPASVDRQGVTVMKGHHAYTTKSSPFMIMPDGVLDSRQVISSGGEDGNVYTWTLTGSGVAPLVCVGRLVHHDTVNLVNYCPNKPTNGCITPGPPPRH